MALIKVPKMNAHDYVNVSWVNISELFQKGLIKSKIMMIYLVCLDRIVRALFYGNITNNSIHQNIKHIQIVNLHNFKHILYL